jgi:hypothetical protein
MQTLNVGAGRTDKEYEEAEEQRRADLRAESRSNANYFFWAGGLAAVSTGMLPVRLNILVNIGVFDLLPRWSCSHCGHSGSMLKWFQGQKALNDLNQPGVSTF